jgi:dihydroorotate dehydrogenase
MNLLYQSYGLSRKLLFALDPEAAHNATMSALQKAYDCRATRAWTHNLPIAPKVLMGLTLKNPVGLAAGLDKDGAHIDALGNLGFGFIEVGTVTPRPQPGNPKPRMFRLPQAQALINRMGFNNAGLEQFLENVKRSQYRAAGGILGLNIGKNADIPIEKAIDDYLLGLDAVYAHADYITVNISSPNTKNLRDLQSEQALNQLLATLNERRKALSDQQGRYVPIALKIAPDIDDQQIRHICQALTSHHMDAVIATNTTVSRATVEGIAYADEAGGLSGAPVHEMSLEVISKLRLYLEKTFPIIGVGGILSGKDAVEKIEAGADAVQLYTGLIYRGPALIEECVNAIKKTATANN